MNTTQNQRGFTIIEVIIAIIVLTVGILGMVTTAALVTRMIARGQRSAMATAFAARRLERMRVEACSGVAPANGSDTLYRGSTWVTFNNYTFTNAGNLNWRLKIVTTYRTAQNNVRSDSSETTIPCGTF
ncbi:MAG TPA: prepilin-type N-terminal cleavage/methylation domain-containing protein [Gemmatimonadales bacterium]|nr:prepilin-type N-terminal cleavage/methylation domain-containing protein [Gemmatimonadales bacterium]